MVAEENIGAQEEAELWSRLENAEEVRKYLRTLKEAARLAVDLRARLRLLQKDHILMILAILFREREHDE